MIISLLKKNGDVNRKLSATVLSLSCSNFRSRCTLWKYSSNTLITYYTSILSRSSVTLTYISDLFLTKIPLQSPSVIDSVTNTPLLWNASALWYIWVSSAVHHEHIVERYCCRVPIITSTLWYGFHQYDTVIQQYNGYNACGTVVHTKGTLWSIFCFRGLNYLQYKSMLSTVSYM